MSVTTPAPLFPLLAPPDERAARADLGRQISRLEAELSAAIVETRPTHPAGAAHSAAWRRGPRLQSLGQLELIRDHLLARLGAVRTDALAEEEQRARARSLLEAMYADPGAHRWTRVSRDDLGLPGCGHYHVRPRLGLVGVLRGWWVVKVSSGCPLAS
jgi:hypothetical protein